VTLLSFVRKGEVPDFASLNALCRTVQTMPWTAFNPSSARALLGFFSSSPRSIVDTYSREVARLVTQELETNTYDIVLAGYMLAAVHATPFRGVPMVLEGVQTIEVRELYEKAESVRRRVRFRFTWAKTLRYLGRLLPHFDACTVASVQEYINLTKLTPEYNRIHIIPNGVDLDYYRPNRIEPTPNTLIHNGALTFDANYDAMHYFLQDIFPRIRAQVLEATLRITGSTVGVAIEQLPLDPGVTFTGHVQDIRPIVASSWACVVPLRIGGGTRLKILEAMALGTPVIATSKGAEGLDVTPGEDILIADEPAEFAIQTIRLLRNGDLRRHLAHNARKLVERKYSWIEMGQKLNDVLEMVVEVRRLASRVEVPGGIRPL
jgi:glycosyltransferase involved in cell wall biosynthesis